MQIDDKMVEAALDAADYIPNNDNRVWMRAALTAALATPPSPTGAEAVESLDERMKAAGMIPLSDLLSGNTPLEKWMAHTAVRDLDSFEWWLNMRHREFMTMRMGYELGDKDKTDELYEWVFAHAAAFGEVVSNFRAMKEGAAPPAAEAVVKPLEWIERRNAFGPTFHAKTSIDLYIAATASGEGCQGTWYWFVAGDTIKGWANSEGEAKAAAQADYEARIRSALAAPASLPDGWVAVPETALKWLFGEGPDEDGNWFGDGATSDKGRYWWRASFRAMLPAAPANAKGDRADG